MLLIAAALTMFAVLITLNNWRNGIYVVIAIGLLQDPFRKLTPGLPPYYVVWAAAVFAIVVFVAYVRHASGRFSHLYLYSKDLRNAWLFFALVVLLQALHALIRWQNPLLPTLGLLFYFGPVAALLVGIGLGRTIAAINRFMIVYVVIMLPAVLTVYLSSAYSDTWPVLKEIGELAGGNQLIIYDLGTALESYSGVFRVGEIAAWHAATCASFLLILVSQNKSVFIRILTAALVVLLIGAIVLTGRRKMLMTLTIFVIAQLGFMVMFRRKSSRQAFTLMLFGVIGSLALTLLDPASKTGFYIQRSVTVFEEAGERLGTAVDLLMSAIVKSSGIGLGAGVSAQGSHYVANTAPEIGGAGEAGLGKIVLELGVPGAFAVLALAFLVSRRIFRCLRILARTNDRLFFYSASFSAMLVANMATFLVATQVYGDLFILTILGLLAGFVFALIHAGLKLDAEQRLLRRHMVVQARDVVESGSRSPAFAGDRRASGVSVSYESAEGVGGGT